MKRSLNAGILCAVRQLFVAALCLGSLAAASASPQHPPKIAVRVLMVSDIHFEPFWDPGKVKKLAAAPVPKWGAILGAPPSADRAGQFAALQKTCHAKGIDTDYTLLASSLRAMRTDANGVRFVTVSGDLLSHDFSCKYTTLFPHSTAAGYQAFAAKTLEFVMHELRGAFAGVPVYAALGNNDSGCGDYHLDASGQFLAATGAAMLADVPKAELKAARRDYGALGDYSVTLPAPMGRTRLLVVDDIFMSENYSTCGGKHDAAPAAAQITWLRTQLERARRNREQVWVMSHIPPGINPFSTIRKMTNVCAGDKPAMFLTSDALPATIADFGDVVRLAIFAHTHMDELRLLRAPEAGEHENPVALKMIPSISPVHGNNPSFVIASVDPATAVLKDYRVIAASNLTGVDTKWSREYDFDRAYKEPAFSPASVEQLIAGFRADPGAKTQASEDYLRDYFVGDRSQLLKLFWPEYVCTLDHYTAAGFKACMCGAGAQAVAH